MRGRYEIKDSENPDLRGIRFTKVTDAWRELEKAWPPGRFLVWDRLDKCSVASLGDDGDDAA